MTYWIWILGGFLLTATITPFLARFSAHFGIVDEPDGHRKIHTEPIPLLGGLVPYLVIAIGIITALLLTDRLTSGAITPSHYIGFLCGGAVLMIGGWLDDVYRLPPRVTILFPMLAAGLAIAGGIEVTKLTNPFGGVLLLSAWQSGLLVFGWLMVVMYVTKLLDGLDGLDTSVVSVGTLAIILLSLSTAYFQPDVALFGSIGIGALLGFLVWNWSPARIFLGEGGSTFLGYYLGVLAVISGGKLATALLVLGIPLLDLFFVIIRRARRGAHAIVEADRGHLHHQLLDRGWSQPRIVLFYLFFALVFGVGALFLQSGQKALVFLILFAVMLFCVVLLSRKSRL